MALATDTWVTPWRWCSFLTASSAVMFLASRCACTARCREGTLRPYSRIRSSS